ncbi:hypothetical protein ON010_g18937 [Phytophthora cinnamomi]|nr:hypothetical protein ON010_g18937 [Phytophthora cinnamomi]
MALPSSPTIAYTTRTDAAHPLFCGLTVSRLFAGLTPLASTIREQLPAFQIATFGDPVWAPTTVDMQDSDAPMRATIEYDNGKTLMARGPQALHDHVASRMEKALGKSLPQMEVRFKDVSISADIMVKDETDVKVELPTLVNVLKTGFREMRSSKHVVKKQVLKNVSGVFKPGTITLVLGQPGSGKSSLMKLLSGRFPRGKNITMEGQVTYNA